VYALLQVDNASFSYVAGLKPGPTTAVGPGFRPAVLDNVSLTIDRGAVVGILGPNGSGKTTLLRLLSGTRRATSGRVLLDGRPLDTLTRREVARHVAVVPQETLLTFDYTVLEMVLMGRHPHLGLFELEGPDDLAIAREMLRATGTEQLESRRFGTLSGGEKQRVVVAAALAQAADVLLLDEPTASLDLAYQLEIAALLSALNLERGVTIAVSTHDLNLAASVCRELVLLKEGRVLAYGPTETVLTPANVRALYDVDADIQRHGPSGHLVVVPLQRIRP
jgi:iron complex transport system ATP-binding protein